MRRITGRARGTGVEEELLFESSLHRGERCDDRPPSEYIRIITTGRIEPMLRATEAQLNTLSAENDALKAGRPAKVFTGQDHATHVREHQALLGVDTDPAVVAVIEQHCAEHYTMWSQMPQDLAALTGQSVMPPPPPMMAPGGPPVPSFLRDLARCLFLGSRALRK